MVLVWYIYGSSVLEAIEVGKAFNNLSLACVLLIFLCIRFQFSLSVSNINRPVYNVLIQSIIFHIKDIQFNTVKK